MSETTAKWVMVIAVLAILAAFFLATLMPAWV